MTLLQAGLALMCFKSKYKWKGRTNRPHSLDEVTSWRLQQQCSLSRPLKPLQNNLWKTGLLQLSFAKTSSERLQEKRIFEQLAGREGKRELAFE